MCIPSREKRPALGEKKIIIKYLLYSSYEKWRVENASKESYELIGGLEGCFGSLLPLKGEVDLLERHPDFYYHLCIAKSSELLPEIPRTKTLVNLSPADENPRRLRGDFT